MDESQEKAAQERREAKAKLAEFKKDKEHIDEEMAKVRGGRSRLSGRPSVRVRLKR